MLSFFVFFFFFCSYCLDRYRRRKKKKGKQFARVIIALRYAMVDLVGKTKRLKAAFPLMLMLCA